jgi:flagellar basal body-associated protein FliL
MLKKIYYFYRDGFRAMKLGKQLWIIIAIKLFILFAVVKYLFFPNVLEERFENDAQRSDYVLQQLTLQGENNGTD